MAYSDDIRRVASADIPWNDLNGKNILVTGATGMIGSSLVEVLLEHMGGNYNVYASGRNEDRVKTVFSRYADDSRFHFLKYDVREQLEGSTEFHIIISGAGVASPQLYATDPVSVMKSNFNGVDNLFSYGVKHNLEKFLYISSGEVYGEGDGRIFTEDYSGYVDCATLRACYPSAKRASESLCVAYGHQYGIDVRIARPCHVYGPNFSESDQRVYAQFIRNVLDGKDIVMKSTGEQFRSWCYVADCVAGLMYILLKGRDGEAYNIADENSNVTIKELAEMIAGIAGREVVTDLPSEQERAGFNVVKKSVYSAEKLMALGWTVRGTMPGNLENTINEVIRLNRKI